LTGRWAIAETNVASVDETAAERDLRVLRERVVYALDCLEVGDQVTAVESLLVGLEGAPATRLPYVCGCGARFRWHGELEGHEHRCGSVLARQLGEQRAA
jgi:hypothetical protein